MLSETKQHKKYNLPEVEKDPPQAERRACPLYTALAVAAQAVAALAVAALAVAALAVAAQAVAALAVAALAVAVLTVAALAVAAVAAGLAEVARICGVGGAELLISVAARLSLVAVFAGAVARVTRGCSRWRRSSKRCLGWEA